MKNESCKTNLLKALEAYDEDDIVIRKLYIYFLRLIKAIHRISIHEVLANLDYIDDAQDPAERISIHEVLANLDSKHS